jgi:hypothetical protein
MKPELVMLAKNHTDTVDISTWYASEKLDGQRCLWDGGFTVGKTDVLAVEVVDKTGGLATVLKSLHSAGINVEYMYAFVNKSGENAVLIFRFEKMDEAIEVLLKDGFTLLSGEQICAL